MAGMIQIQVGRGLQVEPMKNLRVPKGGDESGARPGTYRSAGVQDQLDANRNLAHDIQAKVVDRMRTHISSGKRASASTGRLVRVTADPQNIVVTKEYVGVGNIGYLDRSGLKYWRIFEEGTQGFVGTELFGMAGATFPTAHGEKPGLRTVTEGFELPTKGGKSLGRLFVVQHEIQPANIYGAVAAEYRGAIPALSLQFARRVLNSALQSQVREQVIAGPPAGAPSASQLWYRK